MVFGFLSGWVAPGTEREVVDKFFFAILSCWVFWFLLWMLMKSYRQSQQLNGRSFETYLTRYLNVIRARAANVGASARDAIHADEEAQAPQTAVNVETPHAVAKLGEGGQVAEEDSGAIQSRTVIWIEILHWMTMRVFFIQQFCKIMLFQARRNSLFAAVFVPLAFVLIFAVVNMNLFSAPFWTQDGMIGQSHTSFYLFFPMLLFWVARRFAEAFQPAGREIKKEWPKVADFALVETMNRIMAVYEKQLREWKLRNRGGRD